MLDESQNIEYKESWRDEYLKCIWVLVSASGGRIFIAGCVIKDLTRLDNA